MNEWLDGIQVSAKSVLHRLGHKVAFCDDNGQKCTPYSGLCSCCKRKFVIYVSDMPDYCGDFAALLEVNKSQMTWHICDLEKELSPQDVMSGLDAHYFCERVKSFL